jgi:hypothetical protein
MTQAGLEAIVAPVEDSADQIPGPVTVDLNPAVADSNALSA